MLTCREHIDQFRKTNVLVSPLWVHALDLLKHTLKGDTTDTFYMDKSPSTSRFNELRQFLDGKPKEVDAFLEARHNDFVQARRWTRVDSECGDLSVERYLDGEPRPFNDYRKLIYNKPGVTIIFDGTVPFSQRELNHMSERHKLIYKCACDANREGRPTRVISVERTDIREKKGFKLFVVLKDFDDPIFPSIWAAYESNRMANSFANVVYDYFIGTHDDVNGNCTKYDISEDREIFGDTILVEPVTWVYDSSKRR